MIHRALDVVFQYLFRLIAGLLVIPVLVGGVAFAVDRSQVVAARVWADRPVFTPKFATDRFASYRTPAQIEASLMQELVGTDAFVSNVLSKTEPQYGTWSREHRAQAAVDFRKRVSIEPEAEHLFVISYKTERPEYGITVLKAVLDAFSVTVQDLEAGQVTTAQNALQTQLEIARKDMNTAVAQAESYKASYRLDDRASAADPNYATLLAQARTKTDRYLTLLALVDEAQASHLAVVTIQASIFHVVDPPAVAPPRIGRSTPAVRYALTALGGIASLEALLVYVVARRDPTVRSIEDVRRQVGLRPLGTAPVVSLR